MIGARLGVGPWYVGQVEHLWSREGYVTWCDVWTSKSAYDEWKADGSLTCHLQVRGWAVDAHFRVGSVDRKARKKAVPIDF